MARLETDIVAKSSFYAGVVQAYTPEELPEDMRTNGNTLLHDIVKSLSSAKDVDNGDFIGTYTVDQDGILRDSEEKLIAGITVVGVIANNRKLEEVGKLEFFSDYAMNSNVYCITVDEDENVYVRTHLPLGTSCIVVGAKPVSITTVTDNADSEYLYISCRKACEQYIVDLLAFRIATLYQMSTAEGLASCMVISLNTAKRPYVNHVNEADPVLGMKKLLNRGSFINNFDKGY